MHHGLRYGHCSCEWRASVLRYLPGLACTSVEKPDQRLEQRARSPLQLQPMSLLPLAARCRRIEPGAKSLDRSCHLEWCEEQCAMVHHAKWSGPRSAVQAERQRGE